jgi:hypothetical protein
MISHLLENISDLYNNWVLNYYVQRIIRTIGIFEMYLFILFYFSK